MQLFAVLFENQVHLTARFHRSLCYPLCLSTFGDPRVERARCRQEHLQQPRGPSVNQRKVRFAAPPTIQYRRHSSSIEGYKSGPESSHPDPIGDSLCPSYGSHPKHQTWVGRRDPLDGYPGVSCERLLDEPEASIDDEIDQLLSCQAPQMALFFKKESVSTFAFNSTVDALADFPL